MSDLSQTSTYAEMNDAQAVNNTPAYAELGNYNMDSRSVGKPYVNQVVITPSFGGAGYSVLQNNLPRKALMDNNYFSLSQAYDCPCVLFPCQNQNCVGKNVPSIPQLSSVGNYKNLDTTTAPPTTTTAPPTTTTAPPTTTSAPPTTTTAPPTKCTYQPSQQQLPPFQIQPLELNECFILSSEVYFEVQLGKKRVAYNMKPSFSDDGTATIHTKIQPLTDQCKSSSEDVKISKDQSVNHKFYMCENLYDYQIFEFVNMGPENGIKITYTFYMVVY